MQRRAHQATCAHTASVACAGVGAAIALPRPPLAHAGAHRAKACNSEWGLDAGARGASASVQPPIVALEHRKATKSTELNFQSTKHPQLAPKNKMSNTFNEFSYLEKISYLSYYFHCLHKNSRGDGDSRLIKLLNPISSNALNWRDLRNYILNNLIRTNGYNLITTASKTDCWLRTKAQNPIDIQDAEEKIKQICGRYENSIKNVEGKYEGTRKEKCLQLIRLFWLMSQGAVTHHSRPVEFFFSNTDIYLGRTDAAPSKGAHPEHVVPCAFIRDLFLDYFKSRKLVVDDTEDTTYANDLVKTMNRIIGVAHISQAQKKILDANKERSMKTKMPENWDPLTDDIFARLTTHGWGITIQITK